MTQTIRLIICAHRGRIHLDYAPLVLITDPADKKDSISICLLSGRGCLNLTSYYMEVL